MEVSVTNSKSNKLFFKYNFKDDYLELYLNNPRSASGRGKGRRNLHEDQGTSSDNIELKRAYHQPIIKALHKDLQSLCTCGAIPRFYHPLYNSMSFSVRVKTNNANECTVNSTSDYTLCIL
jgi:hypothetical protein